MAAHFSLDTYVVDTLMPDLVLHDHRPSAFLVYLYLSRRAFGGAAIRASHQQVADATGLSKSAVQGAMLTLSRRRLIRTARESSTAVPLYTVLRPWRK